MSFSLPLFHYQYHSWKKRGDDFIVVIVLHFTLWTTQSHIGISTSLLGLYQYKPLQNVLTLLLCFERALNMSGKLNTSLWTRRLDNENLFLKKCFTSLNEWFGAEKYVCFLLHHAENKPLPLAQKRRKLPGLWYTEGCRIEHDDLPTPIRESARRFGHVVCGRVKRKQ